jgi:site-specific recombinase XerD
MSEGWTEAFLEMMAVERAAAKNTLKIGRAHV